MAELKTKKTTVSVRDFLAKVPSETRRRDAQALAKVFGKATGWKARMWGPTIVGFGSYQYVYDSGHSGEACVVGFSPRKTSLVVYGLARGDGHLKKLGKHKTSGGCIHINTLADIDVRVLEQMIVEGVAATSKKWPVSRT